MSVAEKPAPVFPPGSIFTVHCWDEHYDRGYWYERFPGSDYPTGLDTADLAALTARKFAAALDYQDRHLRTCQSEMWVSHPLLMKGEYPPDEDGARLMWDALREAGIVPFEVAA